MKESGAIRKLECEREKNNTPSVDIAYSMAIAALEKQIPKKPIIAHKTTYGCEIEFEWECPVCGENYIESAPCGEWCGYCGQKLDWSE